MSRSASQFKLMQRLRSRLIALSVFISLVFVVLLVRLAYLQLAKGEEFFEKSQRVIRKVVSQEAPRGEFFDRNYISRENSQPLVANTTSLTLAAIPTHFKENELEFLTEKLEELLNLSTDELSVKIKTNRQQRNEELILIEELSENQLSIIGDYYLTFSKFIIRQKSKRLYNLGQAAAHITGYIGPPTRNDIKKGIRSYQQVGKNGLEMEYDLDLRGEDGEIVQIKSASGSIEEQKIFKRFIPGNNLVLTIDEEIQLAAYQAFAGKTGGLVAIRPNSGEIIALVSNPAFDPNILVSNDRDLRKVHLGEVNQQKAELNRVISAKYPPASTFKPLVALAALEEKRIRPSQKYNCNGKFVLKSTYKGFPDTVFHDWRRFGYLNLVEAIKNSCSVYFYELGYKIGSEPIIRYSRYFMLNKISRIDLPAEISGFVPSPEWKEQKMNLKWFDGDTVNLSIGQGFIETTLLGMVNFYSALAMNGVVYRPHLVKEIRFAENDQQRQAIEPQILYEIPISRSTLKYIRSGLKAVTESGTARSVFRARKLPPFAGKTGTVQTRSQDRFANKTQHAWFIGYGPTNEPPDKQLVIGVFVELGVAGSVGAAPAARDIYKLWVNKIENKDIKL
jgi:penicillin-binding protein 2